MGEDFVVQPWTIVLDSEDIQLELGDDNDTLDIKDKLFELEINRNIASFGGRYADFLTVVTPIGDKTFSNTYYKVNESGLITIYDPFNDTYVYIKDYVEANEVNSQPNQRKVVYS